ncbi:NUDIX domain-containing protein [Microbacterium sp. ARD32]|uniref:NUDIX hydrolase n=1 Tax=Microbacterium sp. ARD32 TaxID=2962577 RepID=UPI002882A3CF|nr:NUDIX domain-containing protein [Microbacterium sp. ARD32]MDT0156666.1 NUDIX domain-containing protein [Microbacterium sp. ARD32]
MTGTTGENDAIRVAVSAVIFSLRTAAEGDRLMLPLVRRTRDPHRGAWALPGGWLDPAEDLDAAASRTLAETTGLKPSYLEQLYTFGDLGRSPTRAISIVYWALLRSDLVDAQRAAVGAPENVEWFDVDALPALAFDHNRIADCALDRLRNKVAYSRIAAGLLPDEFTLTELREVYETVLGRRLDPSNFRRLLEGSDELVPTESFRTGKHRPARLYRYHAEA